MELDSPSMTELSVGDIPVDGLQNVFSRLHTHLFKTQKAEKSTFSRLARIFEKVHAEERSFEHGFEKLGAV